MPPRNAPRKLPRSAKPRGYDMDMLVEKHIAGKPVSSAYSYDRKDMDVATPAERVKLNPRKVDMASANRTLRAAGAANPYEFLNSSARKGRRDRYAQKLAANRNATRIVSEGDSWHLYPILIREIIDHLNDDPKLAIFSTDGAGDTLESIWAERGESNKGFQKSIAMERPSVFLFNGGGNDLLQGRPGPDGKTIGSLYFHLKDYRTGMTAADLILPTIEASYDMVEMQMRAIIAKALEFASIKRIVFHGYDYPFPANDLWLGKPMARRGIASAILQRQICILLMDKLHSRLVRVQQSFAATGKVVYVDVRNTLPNKSQWDDELHPNSAGFKKIAAKIRAKI
jgi:lysophospholipase L1-like esterase